MYHSTITKEIKCFVNLWYTGENVRNYHCCTLCYSNVLYQISQNVQSAHACWCNKRVIVWLVDYLPVHTRNPYNNFLFFRLKICGCFEYWAVHWITEIIIIYAQYSLHFFADLNMYKLLINKSNIIMEKVSMIRKYHNHALQTNPWHREEELLNTNSQKDN